MNADEKNSFFTRDHGGVCYQCRYVLPRLVDTAPTYFAEGYWTCANCGMKLDLWRAVLSEAQRFQDVPSWALQTLGAAETRIVRPLETGTFNVFKLEEYGIPSSAKVLAINISGCDAGDGAVAALMWHGNTVSHRIYDATLSVFAVALGGGKQPRTAPVSIGLTWIRREESDGWVYLSNAFESAAAHEYAPALVFAQSAIEISLMPLISKKLRQFAAANNVKSFMTESLKFSHALNVVLPNICGHLAIPRIPDPVRGALNKLRKTRNLIVHEGLTAADMTPAEVAEGLCAASLGFEYVRYITLKLSSPSAVNEPTNRESVI